MLNIAIIGCGQIGSRHLQALAKLEEEAAIHLVDISDESLLVAHGRFNDVWHELRGTMIHIKKHSNLTSIEETLDIAIIAANSLVRASLTESLLIDNPPKYLVLEKFLFQYDEEYDLIESLIYKTNVKAYVNQWISSNYIFQRAAQWIGAVDNMKVYGDNWGLACNSVHYIDYFDMLIGRMGLEVKSHLFSKVVNSKRGGYYEINGKLVINSSNGSELELSSEDGVYGNDNVCVKIENIDRSVSIIMTPDNRVACEFKDKSGVTSTVNSIPFQSNVTQNIVQSLMLNGRCDLPEYTRSAYQHRMVLPVFKKYLKYELKYTGEGCPIT